VTPDSAGRGREEGRKSEVDPEDYFGGVTVFGIGLAL